MRHTIARFLLSLLALLVIAGCQNEYQKQLSQSVTLTSAQLAPDVKLAVAAVVMRMKGFDRKDIPYARFDEGAEINLREAQFAYEGFVVQGLTVVGYGPRNGDAQPVTELGAVVLLSDSLGRRTAVRLLAHYRVVGTALEIKHASITPVYPQFPQVEAFIVPNSGLPADRRAISRSHAELYRNVVGNALAPGAPSPDRNNLLFFFMRDRLSPTAVLKGRVSEQHINLGGYENATVILDYAGWRVGGIQGTFDPGGTDKLFAKVVYTPGEDVSFFLRGNRLLAAYGMTRRTIDWGIGEKVSGGATEGGRTGSSPSAPVAAPPLSKSPRDPTPSAPPPATKKRVAVPPPAPPAEPASLEAVTARSGVLSNGLTLLDPENVGDAQRIKARLAQLGYFDDRITGAWSPSAQAALLRFGTDMGLPSPGIWNVDMQMALFAGTGF